MKNTNLLTSALLGLTLGSASATVIYTETFDEPSAVDVSDYAGWSYAATSSGTVNAPSGDYEPAVSGALFHFPRVGGTGGTTAAAPMFIYTDAGEISPYAYTGINNITFSINNNNANEDLRFALKVDGAWYVSDEVYNATGGFAPQAVDPFVDTTFSVLDFTANTTLGIGAATTLPTTGTLEGFGIYNAAYSGAGGGSSTFTYRFDDISIDAVPEPSSTALLGLASIGLLLRRRR